MSGRTGVVVMAYGTPSGPDQVLAYYTDIRRGRPPTDEQLADLTRRYQAIGGVSPLAERTEAQRAAIAGALGQLAPGRYEVVLGLKHADPKIEAAVDALAGRGDIAQVVGLALAPHYSSMSIGQYLQRLAEAAATHDLPATGVESWAIEPALIEFLAGAVREQLRALPARTRIVFTAHALPARILADGDPYPAQLGATAAAVTDRLGLANGAMQIGWQSAGRTAEPWLGPDILQTIDTLAADPDVDGVLVCACGFVADHLEVLYDLDIEAKARAEGQGLAFARTSCVNADPAVMSALAARVHACAESTG
jgi:ferrochelatase